MSHFNEMLKVMSTADNQRAERAKRHGSLLPRVVQIKLSSQEFLQELEMCTDSI